MKRILTIVCALLFITATINAQTLVKGIVKEKVGEQEQPLPFANVYLEGTTTGTTTNFDGYFELVLEAGTHMLSISFIGYEKVSREITVDGVTPFEINVTLESGGGQKLEEIEVAGRANRENEVILMMDQKKAVVAVEAIGAKQLKVQGVSDAAGAATKITGIVKQEGAKTLNVRGLGDRYNTTLLNGLPIPSNNAETKNIDLELFGTDVIEFIGVEKIFSANRSGDFGGANVNIVSKKFSGDPYISLGAKTGINSSVFETDQFYLQDGPGFWGLDNFQQTTSLQSYRSFETNWNPVMSDVNPNAGFSLDAGKTFKFDNNSKLNTFFTVGFENNKAYSKVTQNRINGSDFWRKRLSGDEFGYSTQTTAMLNLNYQLRNHSFYYNAMLLNSSDQEFKNLYGFVFDRAEDSAMVRRAEFERTSMLVNQLLGEHAINDGLDLNWGVSYNHVNNIIPDRKQVTLNGLNDGQGYFIDIDPSDHYRYFHDFKENEIAANFDVNFKYGDGYGDKDYRSRLTLGGAAKYKIRNFASTQFNHDIYRNRSIFNPPYEVYVDINNIDAFLNHDNLQKNEFYVQTFFGNVIRPSTYDGTTVTYAGFLNYEYNISPKLLALLGFRYEYIYQSVDFVTSLYPSGGTGDFSKHKPLPALSLKYMPNEDNNIRFALGKTYVLPQYTEMAEFLFEGITETTVGNRYIYESDIYNADIKWEWYPNKTDMVSVAGFGKYIQNPINKLVVASASNDYSFANTGDWAYVYGAEFEVKKTLLTVSRESQFTKVFINANLSLMRTKQELNGEKIYEESNGRLNIRFNTETDELQGAAPLIANANLGYRHDWLDNDISLTGSVVYNYVSDRIYLIGTSYFGNQVDKAVHSLDFVLSSSIKAFSVNFKAQNILNPDISRMQENETQDWLVNEYKRGTKFTLGLSYQF